MTAKEWADCHKIGGTQVDLVNRCSLLLREIDRLTQERDAARRGLFSHLTGEHQLAEPTYAELKAKLAEQTRRAEQAEQERDKMREGAEEMAKEYHALLHEEMYAGTRADWIARARRTEERLAQFEAALKKALTFHQTTHIHAVLEAALADADRR